MHNCGHGCFEWQLGAIRASKSQVTSSFLDIQIIPSGNNNNSTVKGTKITFLILIQNNNSTSWTCLHALNHCSAIGWLDIYLKKQVHMCASWGSEVATECHSLSTLPNWCTSKVRGSPKSSSGDTYACAVSMTVHPGWCIQVWIFSQEISLLWHTYLLITDVFME